MENRAESKGEARKLRGLYQRDKLKSSMAELTTNPNDPRLKRGVDSEPGPQNDVYLVLSEEERAKGFVRPLRRSYLHVGYQRKCQKSYVDEKGETWVCNLHDRSQDRCVGWGKASNERKGCGKVTTMGLALCETYARDPKFYGATYCTTCQRHLPVNEFKWVEDGQEVGS